VPLVPVVIRGTRQMLSASMWFPHRSRLAVIVKPPVRHNGEEDAIPVLRQACRDSILEDLPEADAVGPET
jgi:1-acyl-sn-glycerol-3-phosphate acyltransferase